MKRLFYELNENYFNNKTILITGGAGFIGSNLAFYIQENFPECKIVILDIFRKEEKLSNGNLKSLGNYKNIIGFKGTVIVGDVNDSYLLSKLNDDYKFDYIFHFAAISDTTALEQDLIINTNVCAYESILKIAINHGANIVYASSGAAYGDAPAPQTVGIENPNNFYGLSKLMMDKITYSYINSNPAISIVGLRYFNVYGPREFFKNKTASMILQLGLQILRGDAPKLFEGSDKILRDFVYIEDAIQASVLASRPKKSGVYNVGTGKSRSFQEIVDILQKELGTDYRPIHIKNPYVSHYQFFTQANIDDTKFFLDFVPKFSLEDGIKAYLPEMKRIFESNDNIADATLLCAPVKGWRGMS